MAFNPNEHMINMARSGQTPRLYLETKWRLVWLREEHPSWRINTDIIQLEPAVVIKATIADENGAIVATAHGTAIDKGNAVWSGRAIEKAETAAIGRALAHAGYGTQFTEDDDEADGALADSPVERKAAPKSQLQTNGTPQSASWTVTDIKACAAEWRTVYPNATPDDIAAALKIAVIDNKPQWAMWTGTADAARAAVTAALAADITF